MTLTASPTATTTDRPRLLLPGLGAGVVAGVANLGLVAGAVALGVPMVSSTGGQAFPLLAFAQFSLVGALLGVALAAVLRRRSARPRTLFVRVTVVLTLLTLVLPMMLPTDLGTQLVLVATHLVAAAVVIPVLARRLSPRRLSS